MNLNNGEFEFETMDHSGLFWISIKEQRSYQTKGWNESYLSRYTYNLDQKTARELLNELKLYLGDV